MHIAFIWLSVVVFSCRFLITLLQRISECVIPLLCQQMVLFSHLESESTNVSSICNVNIYVS